MFAFVLCVCAAVGGAVGESYGPDQYLPWITNIASSGMCDTSQGDCTMPFATVDDEVPLMDNETLSCRFRRVEVDEDGPLLTRTMTVVAGGFIDATTARCPVPDGEIPVLTGRRVAAELVSVSNDGIDFSNEVFYFAVDKRCVNCDSYHGSLPVCRWEDDYCYIEGVCYGNGTINPSNECEQCAVNVSAIAWSPVETKCFVNGTCYDAGSVDPQNDCYVCDPDVCRISFSPLDTKCYVNGTCYDAGTVDPENNCQACDPDVSLTSFTLLNTKCYVDGVCYDEGSVDPENSCRVCNTSVSLTSLTPLDTKCYVNGTCYDAGSLDPENSCQACDPDVSLTSFTTLATKCYVDGTCYDAGPANPENSCQVCDPDVSLTSLLLLNTTCFVDGTCYDAGSVDPENGCQACDPDVSVTSFTTLNTKCYVNGTCYDSESVDPQNSCQACDPDVSLTSFTTLAEVCTIGDMCYRNNEQNPDDTCDICVVTSPTTWTRRVFPRGSGILSCTEFCDYLPVFNLHLETVCSRTDAFPQSFIQQICLIDSPDTAADLMCPGVVNVLPRYIAFCAHTSVAEARADPNVC